MKRSTRSNLAGLGGEPVVRAGASAHSTHVKKHPWVGSWQRLELEWKSDCLLYGYFERSGVVCTPIQVRYLAPKHPDEFEGTAADMIAAVVAGPCNPWPDEAVLGLGTSSRTPGRRPYAAINHSHARAATQNPGTCTCRTLVVSSTLGSPMPRRP